jgi:serine/threonine protein kinase/Flp pilus assembly protein TadD
VSEAASSSPAALAGCSDLVERLVAEMAAAWRRGARPPAEHYLDRHAELLDHPEEAVRLVYEEVCLRQECGAEAAAEELYRRFPRWAAELAVLLDCHRLMQACLSPAVFPEAGATLGDFRLLAELGRGGHGRVYVAAQTGLADRPVVLKVTPRRAHEHLSLARLQHTHIIPLHAVYDFPGPNLRALCMPFLGGATFAAILDRLRHQPVARRTGRSLVEALDAAQGEGPVRLPGRGGYRQVLTQLSYVEAVCCLGACLADGLHYAHERGLVHLDLKPSNVLLAADAQPLLLDFHLALNALPAGGAVPEGLGGTPGYMAPEQERACAAARRGKPVPEAVDRRADVYGLGRLLYAALADGPEKGCLEKGSDPLGRGSDPFSGPFSGPSPFSGPGDRPAGRLPPLRRRNPQVSVGLSDLVQKCLAPNPADRYPDAAALAADLRRHLAHRPLRGVANRSLRERWHKWRRRRPNATLWLGLVVALLTAAGLLAVGAREPYQDARAALAEGQGQIERKAYEEAIRTLSRGQARVEGLPGGAGLREALGRELAHARRARAAAELHAVAENLRFLAGADVHAARDLQALEAQCRMAWSVRGLVLDDAAARNADPAEQTRADLLDLALVWVDLKRRLGQQGGPGDGRAEIAAILDEAETVLGSSPALACERRRLAGTGIAPPPALARRSAWEYVAVAQALLRAGELERAAEVLERAADLRPQDFWANFCRGVCAYRRGHFDDAVGAFGVAIALAPASAVCYYNRALAHASWGKSEKALHDYGRALQLDPHLAAAALNRGILHYQEGHTAQARADLEQALHLGAEPASAHYNLALVHLALEDRAAAQRHLEQALTHNPSHADAKVLRERLAATP